PSQRETLRHFWRLGAPVVLTNMLQSLVNVVDVFMVGRLGPLAIAAVGMGSVINMLVLVMVLSVSAGGMSLIAQAKGARDPEQMSFVTRQAISSGVMVGIILTAIGFAISGPLLRFANSGGDPEAIVLGQQYLNILFAGMIFLVLNTVFNRLMQGAGDTLTPLYLTGGLNLLNIGLNYVFMFGPGPLPAFGIGGAAMGTITARFLGVIAALWLIYAKKNVVRLLPGSYRPDWRMYYDIMAIGVPSGVQGLFRNGSRLLIVSILTSTEVGTYGAAALAIGLQVESLAFMPGLGLNVASTSLVGQSLGKWQTDEAQQRGNIGIWLGIILMTVLSTPIIAFAPAIVRLFDPSAHPAVAAAGVSYLRISTVTQPLAAVALVANGAMRGAGDSLPGMLSTMTSRALVAVILSQVLAVWLGMGSIGVWYAIAIGNI
ncbi:MAG: MATE family efflux transporter, partial [Anaerolineales bacterium]|nr:MATE family efflux transporter [Anaerolineales bacterium]